MFSRLAKIALVFGALATVGLTMLPPDADAQGRRCYRSGNHFVCE